jgi:hypothetical protein
MARNRSVKRRRSLRRTRRKACGGGWSEGPNMVNPGNLVHNPYTGPGKDCTGNPESIRPGYISSYASKGLPGLSGGAKRRRNRSRGGADNNPGPITNPNNAPVSGSLTPKPANFPDTTGVGGTVAQPGVTAMSMPGVPTPGVQNGGRYGFFPEMGPLNPNNGVGVSPAPFGRIPCETGTYNPLNPDPNDIQTMSTAPSVPPYVTRGGASSANFPVVHVGDVDAMRYYAPTAGYRNDFMTFRAPSPVPGLTIQTPYDAKAFNQACIKTGGSRKNRKGGARRLKNRRSRGGAVPVALDAGKFTPVTLNEVWTRKDFDGSDKLLPVKFGGKRRTYHILKNKRKTYKRNK